MPFPSRIVAPSVLRLLGVVACVLTLVLVGGAVVVRTLSPSAHGAGGAVVRKLVVQADESGARVAGEAALACDGDLSALAASAVPSQSKFRYAVWIENGPLGVSSAFPQTVLTDPEVYGQQLRVVQVRCNTGSDAATHPYVIVPASGNSSEHQSRVILTAARNQVEKNLFLIYMDTSNAYDLPVMIVNGRAHGLTLDGGSFQEGSCASDSDLCGFITVTRASTSEATYAALVTMRHPRGIKSAAGSVEDGLLLAGNRGGSITQIDDSSTIEEVIKTFRVTVMASGITTRTRAVANAQRYQSVLLRPLGVTKASRTEQSGVRLIAYSECTAAHRDSAGIADDCASGWTDTGDIYNSATPDYAAVAERHGRLARPVEDGQQIHSGQTVSLGSPDGIAMRYVVDVIPWLWSNQDMYNEGLRTVRVNNHTFDVEMPQPCLAPGRTDITSADEIACVGTESGQEAAYNQDRAWLSDPQGTQWTDTAHDVGGSFPHRLLLDEQVTSGDLAGARVRVTLLNARAGSDLLSLSHYGRGSCLKSSSVNGGCAGGVRDSFALTDAARWRYRYSIEVLGLRSPTLDVEVQTMTNAQWRYGVQGMRGVEVRDGAGFDAIEGYGGNDDVGRTFQWRPMCSVYGAQPASAANGCTYFWSMVGYMGDPNRFRFTVRNGYVSPVVRVDGTVRQTDKQVAGDGVPNNYRSFTAPMAANRSFHGWNGSQTFFGNGAIPISVTAAPMDLAVTYKEADGSPAVPEGGGEPFAAVTANVDLGYLVTTPADVPDTHGQAFLGWNLVAYKDGQKVGVIQEGIMPSSNVDIRDLRLATPGHPRALSDEYGEPLADELRFEVATQGAKFSKYPAFYPVARRLLTSPERTETAFSYRAVSGLTARLEPSFLARSDTRRTSESGSEDRSATAVYTLRMADSVVGPLSLGRAGSADRLALAYAPESGTVTFSKTVRTDAINVLERTPDAAEFLLVLTPTAGGDPIEVRHGESAEVPVGRYLLGERHRDPDSNEVTDLTTRWVPLSNAYTKAYWCKDSDYNTYSEHVDGNWFIDVKGGTFPTCEVTNVGALLQLVTLDASKRIGGKGAWVNDPENYTYTLSMRSADGSIEDNRVFQANGSEPSRRYVTPNAHYTLVPSLPEGMVFLGVEKCVADQRTCTGNNGTNVVSPLWQKVTDDYPITVAPDSRALYRVVVKPWSEITVLSFESELADQELAGLGVDIVPPATADAFGLLALGEQGSATHAGLEVLANGQRALDITPGRYQLTWLSRRGSADGTWDRLHRDPAYSLVPNGLRCQAEDGTPVEIDANGWITVADRAKVVCRGTFGGSSRTRV